MSWFIEAVKKYAVFSGRSRRREFWYFVLFYSIISLGFALFDTAIGTWYPSLSIGLLSGIFGLALLLPSIAVTVRRLHDVDRSGWWYLIQLIPVVGFLVILYFAVQGGTPGSNRYGPDPKSTAASESPARGNGSGPETHREAESL